jgi:hypothetical protein
MTGIIIVLATISLNLAFIGSYLMRICNCLERMENDEEGGAE